MLVPTLILSQRHSEDSQRLWRAAGEMGWRVERPPTRVPADLLAVEEPVLYVEALLAQFVGEQFGLTLSEPPDDWLPTLPPEYRRRTALLVTAAEARRYQGSWFCKPPNNKAWPASVYDPPAGLPNFVADADPVLMSEVVEFELEYRCFVLTREVVTFSVYLRNGHLQREAGYATTDEEDRQMLAFVRSMLADERVRLPNAVVLDVGRLKQDHRWAAVELNAAWVGTVRLRPPGGVGGDQGLDGASVSILWHHVHCPSQILNPARRAITPRPGWAFR